MKAVSSSEFMRRNNCGKWRRECDDHTDDASEDNDDG